MFNLSWVLIDELAVGPAPNSQKCFESLKKNNLKNILSLCDKSEFPYKKVSDNFNTKFYFLPDHRSKDKLTLLQINNALDILSDLIHDAPTFVHCLYSIERSPLICMAYLIKYKKYSVEIALDYLMSVHSKTNPLNEQIELLYKL